MSISWVKHLFDCVIHYYLLGKQNTVWFSRPNHEISWQPGIQNAITWWTKLLVEYVFSLTFVLDFGVSSLISRQNLMGVLRGFHLSCSHVHFIFWWGDWNAIRFTLILNVTKIIILVLLLYLKDNMSVLSSKDGHNLLVDINFQFLQHFSLRDDACSFRRGFRLDLTDFVKWSEIVIWNLSIVAHLFVVWLKASRQAPSYFRLNLLNFSFHSVQCQKFAFVTFHIRFGDLADTGSVMFTESMRLTELSQYVPQAILSYGSIRVAYIITILLFG